ncbi:MAG: cytochrome C [Campylobacterales bacterium]|nr:cytochrome C [Campylobacterales bacterium]
MKKVMLALVATASLSMASDATINATMSLMKEGMNKINNGFMYNSKEDVKAGLAVVESANDIFKTVDVKAFTKSEKEQVARNINNNIEDHIKALRKAVEAGKYSEGITQYAKVMDDCISCHTIIRGW